MSEPKPMSEETADSMARAFATLGVSHPHLGSYCDMGHRLIAEVRRLRDCCKALRPFAEMAERLDAAADEEHVVRRGTARRDGSVYDLLEVTARDFRAAREAWQNAGVE